MDYRQRFSEVRAEAKEAVLTGVEMKVSGDTLVKIERIEFKSREEIAAQEVESLNEKKQVEQPPKTVFAILILIALIAIIKALGK